MKGGGRDKERREERRGEEKKDLPNKGIDGAGSGSCYKG
jgi:hypothetical protein